MRVKLVDYRPTRGHALGLAFLADARVRRACCAAGAALLAIAATALIEVARAGAAARDVDVLSVRLAALEAAVSHTRVVAREAARLGTIDARARMLRATARAGASAVAAVGNRLPRDVWLTTLRIAPQSLTLEGHGARLSALPPALTALRAASHYEARLVNVATDPARGGISYAIALRDGP